MNHESCLVYHRLCLLVLYAVPCIDRGSGDRARPLYFCPLSGREHRRCHRSQTVIAPQQVLLVKPNSVGTHIFIGITIKQRFTGAISYPIMIE